MGTGQNSGDGSIEIVQQDYCRFAYTLNNTQPVRCTIIGDQPLFYMDFEGAIDDEYADDDFGFELIEKSVSALREKILTVDSELPWNSGISGNGELRMQEFLEDISAITGEESQRFTGSDLQLRAFEKKLRLSRLAAAYLDMAKSHGIGMMYDAHVEFAFYDRDAKVIFLNPDREESEQLVLAARELRRVWQHKNGALLHPLTFQPDQAILINRAQNADLVVSMIRIAWELQLTGIKEAWERLENSSLSDLTRAFAREAYLDFRTLNNGEAATAVFEAWFLSDRCRNEDRRLIQSMLSDYQGYVFDSEQISKSVGADLIVALGSMPFGKNYLAAFASTILSDPIFSEVRDRSNANFLWFIKFECSFREAEQELQTPVTIQGRDSSGDLKTKNTDGDTHEHAATVIALPGMASRNAAPKSGNRASARQASGSGNIVYLNRGKQ